jgi:very-short-patch-repair endonuclease
MRNEGTAARVVRIPRLTPRAVHAPALPRKPSPSRLEDRFLFLWQIAKGPPLEREFRFHAERRWRADFAHLPTRTLIEIEGGVYINGRHNRPAGFNADLEKYLEAGLAGWRVFRLGSDQITMENVERLVSLLMSQVA